MRVGRRRSCERSGNFKHDRGNLDKYPRTECRIMVKASALLLLSLALAGCAMTPQAQLAPQAHLAPDSTFKPARYAWDGAGEDPNQPRSASRHSTRMAASPERDGIDADQD